MRSKLLSLSVSAVLAAGCVVETEGGAPGTEDLLDVAGTVQKTAPVIVGSVNWVETGSLPAEDFWRQKARSVALLWLPSVGSRCTGFLVTPDVLMTNEHCIGSAADAAGAWAVFGAEAGVPESLRESVSCTEFIGNNATLDYALVRCTGRPGDRHGVVELSENVPAGGEAITVIHQNCDYYSNSNCAPDKKLSPGRVTGSITREIQYDADTLGGSSGSAVFDAQGRVVALHHVGVGGDGAGRGSYNQGVKMSFVLAAVRTAHPDLLTAMQPAPAPAPVVTPPSDPTRDRLEPNDDSGSATAITRPYAANNLFIAAGDRDVFKFTLGSRSAVTVQMDFNHAAGDLDLYVYRVGTSSPVARSEGVTNRERISTTLSAGTYLVMAVGYGSATGAYSINVR